MYLVILGLAADFGFNSFHAFLLTTALVYAIAALGLNVSAGLLGQLLWVKEQRSVSVPTWPQS